MIEEVFIFLFGVVVGIFLLAIVYMITDDMGQKK